MAKESYHEDEEEESEGKKVALYGPVNFDHFINRNDKIAMFKRKKDIETQLDMLRDYKDEDKKREFYMAQLQHSVVRSFEQLTLIF